MSTPNSVSPAPGTIALARTGVQQALADVEALGEDPGVSTLAALERRLWTLLLAVGCAVVALWLARRAARPIAVCYQHDGATWKVEGTHGSQVGTRFGKVWFIRPAAFRDGDGEMDLPVDRAIGLCGGMSFGVLVHIAHLCARMSFGQAREVFARSHEWRPSQDTSLRIVDAVGPHARPFLEQLPVPEDDGEVLVVMVDGGGAPMLRPEVLCRRRRPHRPRAGTARETRRARRRLEHRPRRTKGQKSKNSKEAVLAVLYTLRRTPEGWDGPINKRVYGTFESYHSLFEWLSREAGRRGYGRKRTLFLADGSRTIWRLQQKYFPKAEVCLDWYHVDEKLWDAGECLHPEGSVELLEWVEQQEDRLRRGWVRAVLSTLQQARDNIPKTGPGNKGKRTRLKRVRKYLHWHRARLQYQHFLAEGWDIGTGSMEGAVRNVVRLRLDSCSMQWGRVRSELVLHLRCILVSGQWDAFETYLEKRSDIVLASRPVPATPHQAKERTKSKVRPEVKKAA